MSEKNEYPWLEEGELPDAADHMASGLLNGPDIRYYSKDWKRRYAQAVRDDLRQKGWKGLKGAEGDQGQEEEPEDDYDFLRDPVGWNRKQRL